MDNAKSKKLEIILKDQCIETYKIVRLINNGKSAAVFEGQDVNGNRVAVKVFDNEMIERFGHEVQEKRISQEISLKDHIIPNLVKIFSGGKTQIGEEEYYYIIMEFIDGKNLKQFIESETYDNSFLQKVTKTLYETTERLLKEKNIAHRDIKSENIMITDSRDFVLMDLGVLKLVGSKSYTDLEEKQFLGTLRNAPPEFLTREEEDSEQGWRAINLYQIGTVLHDLIMKKELFKDIHPYPNLVIAIKENAPNISNENFTFGTVQLARDLLTKDWKKRLELCSGERIINFYNQDFSQQDELERELEEIQTFSSDYKSKVDEIIKINSTFQEKVDKWTQISNNADVMVEKSIKILNERKLFINYKKFPRFNFSNESHDNSKIIKNIPYMLSGDLSLGYSRSLFLLIRIINDETANGSISLLGLFIPNSLENQAKTLNYNPQQIFVNLLYKEKPNLRNQFPVVIYPPQEFYLAFEGTIGFDEQFEKKMTLEILKIVKKSLKSITKRSSL